MAVVISLKLAYTPVDDTVTAPLCSTSTSINQTPAEKGSEWHGEVRLGGALGAGAAGAGGCAWPR